MVMRVVVIGGGVTGLVAARKLRSRGVAVTLIDRGFPFGGRLRPDMQEIPGYGRAVFDPVPVFLGPVHYNGECADAPLGFPPLGLRTDEFAPEIRNVLGFFPIAHIASENRPARQAPSLEMTLQGGAKALIDMLLPHGFDEHLQMLAQTEVIAIERDGRGWRIHVRECGSPDYGERLTSTIRSDAVLITLPVPEALALLTSSNVPLSDPLADELRRVRYDRTLTVTAAFRGPSQFPIGSAVSFSDYPLALAFDNQTTGASPTGPAVTAVANPVWAAEHWNDSDEEIANRLLPLIAPWAGGEVVWHRIRRQNHYRATNRVCMPFGEMANDVPPLVIAGDGFASYVSNPRDAEYTSASHAVTRLCRTLSREARIAERPVKRTPGAVSLEVCVTSAADALIAIESGADRLLLCVAPEIGGLTPTVDSLRLVRRVVARHRSTVKVTVLVRPRVGGFRYSAEEFQQIRLDTRRLLRAGADGVSFGLLHVRNGEVRIDAERCRVLVEQVHDQGREAVFNRAFDSLTDRRIGLQNLIALGLHRVYTSGGRRLALDGMDELTELVGYAAWDIEIVAAGGISAGFVGCVVRGTGCRHALVDARERHQDPTANPRLLEPGYGVTCGERVREVAAMLRRVERDGEDDRDEECEFEVPCETDTKEEVTATL